jgi:hypothetical protein
MEIIIGTKSHPQSFGILKSLIQPAIDDLESLRDNPYASAYIFWNRASAVKP